jgi:acetyl-CoA decarbonylase/synthase complex subunit delta
MQYPERSSQVALELVKESWTGKINAVTIGATSAEGGTRTSVVTVGGEATMPFLHFEGEMPNRPVIAMEVLDMEPEDWPEVLTEPFSDVLSDPAAWAKKCVEEYKADTICLTLLSAHPDWGDTSAEHAVEIVKAVLEAVGVPLIIWGPDNVEKMNEVIPRCSQAASGENCLIGTASQDNYKTVAAACIADKHKLITESPLDINIAKQVNILVSDMGFDLNNAVLYPTNGGLGYGLEYSYSIMERARLAAFGGDRMLALPIVNIVGREAWRAKESKAPESEQPRWGPESERGPMWEAMTAVGCLQSGADILVMRHPRAVASVRETIDKLMG